MSTTTLILLVLVVLIFTGVGWQGQSRFGAYGWSPLGLILVVLLILYLTGYLRR